MKPYRFYLLYLLMVVAAFYVYSRSDVSVPVIPPLDQFPLTAGSWKMQGHARFDKETLEILRPSDYLYRTYSSNAGDKVSLYVGYHDGGPQSGHIHSPRQCLPASGWNRLNDEVRTLDFEGHKISYVSSVYQKDTEKQFFFYWYQVRGATLTNEYALKLEKIKNSMFANRRDTSFIRLSFVVREDEAVSIRTGEQFIRDFYPAISHALPQ